MKTIKLPTFGIELTISDYKDKGGTIKSDLHDGPKHSRYEAAVNTLESIILAHACAGINVKSPAYLEGIETAVDAVINHLD